MARKFLRGRLRSCYECSGPARKGRLGALFSLPQRGGLGSAQTRQGAALHLPPLILFLERKSIKKNFKFEPKPIAIPEFLPGDEIALLIEE